MKVIVTHTSPDWDAITSVWFLKKYLPGWEDAKVQFVPAGTKLEISNIKYQISNNPIEEVRDNEIIHVDTGLGPLDHHQTSDMNTSAASLAFNFVKNQNLLRHSGEARSADSRINSGQVKDAKKGTRMTVRLDALTRIVRYVVALDHFQEVFWPDPNSDRYEFGLFGILEGYKVQYPNQDEKYVEFGLILLDAMLHRMEERIWAEHELKQKGETFDTRFGKGIAIQTINDDTMKIAQKMGYVIVVRKDPRKGYIRIKAMPEQTNVILEGAKRPIGSQQKQRDSIAALQNGKNKIDLTLIKEQLAKMDPKATWFLHVSKKMLLNGTPKNPKMIPTTLSLQQIVDVVKKV